MILLDLGQQKDWEYDVRAIVSSFYQGEEIMLADQAADTACEGSRILRIADLIPADCRDKNEMKRRFYLSLAAETGKELPWGMLTGIRPTKLTSNYLASGLTEAQAAAKLQADYLVSPRKAALAAQISVREAAVLKDVDPESTYSLYIGIPFCPTTCLYCSFTSYPFKKYEKLADTYLDCVEKEIGWTAERFKKKTCLSIYIGGGTPTTLDPARLRRLITHLKERIDCSKVREFTVECGRPDTIDAERLR
ncbi:MAG: coproporphyrinogen dehydrogenase HemZ, partial [Lachnospiraceae bacterium]|nr:coproporphyrinogen dehydrogenase HemZ [Lachnospiraceae bacterium]